MIGLGDFMFSLWISSNPCEISGVLKIILFVKKLLSYVCVIVPMGLIVMVSIDIGKNVIAGREDEMKKNVSVAMKRIIYCMCIFLVPSVVNLAVNMVNDAVKNANVTASSCTDNLNNIAYYEKLEKIKMKQEEQEQAKILAERFAKTNERNTIKKKASASNNDSNTGGSSVSGQKYDLSDTQLRGLAMIAQREQGTPVGAAAEASLMANLFELKGSNYGSGGAGLYNYVATSGWFGSSAGSYMQNTSGLNPDVLSAVKEVLILGKRTLPLYIDEHDCIDCGAYGFDIVTIITNGTTITDANGLLNRNNYKKDNTIIKNKYGATYTFYSFPTETSDPFGYTEQSRSKFN